MWYAMLFNVVKVNHIFEGYLALGRVTVQYIFCTENAENDIGYCY